MTTTETKTHWKKHFNYDFLGTYALEDGKDLILTIAELKDEEVTDPNGKKSTCFVAHFKEKQKPMILNRTNCKTIQKLYKTPYTELWVGKQIQVYAKEGISAFGSVTDGLRIREFIPKPVDREANKKAELKADIRTILAKLQPIDMKTVKGQLMSIDDVKAMLNKASQDKSDTVEFLQNILNDLKV